jgi:hypothetical protein
MEQGMVGISWNDPWMGSIRGQYPRVKGKESSSERLMGKADCSFEEEQYLVFFFFFW